MTSPMERTRYRIGQLWAFRSSAAGIEHVLQILGVEEHPRYGIFCYVNCKFDPPIREGNNFCENLRLAFTAKALDRSVTTLVEERAPLPFSWRTSGEFRVRPDQWSDPLGFVIEERTVDEAVADLVKSRAEERTQRLQEQEHEQPQPERPLIVQAIEHDNLDTVRKLLDADPDLVNKPISDPNEDASGSPLCYAAQKGRVEIARLLIQRGADVNWSGYGGMRPLHYAAAHGHPEVARLLIDHGADIEVGGPYNTPLQAAAKGMVETGCTAVLAMLEERGAKLDLHTAIYLGRTDWVRDYFHQNPDALSRVPFHESLIQDVIAWIDRRLWQETEDKTNREAIATIIREGRDLVEFLLDRGADPNADSPLVSAVQLPDPAIAELLLQRGADPRDQDTAMFILEAAPTEEMRALLRRFGAQDNPYSYEDPLQAFRRVLGGGDSTR